MKEIISRMRYIKDFVEDTTDEIERSENDSEAIRDLTDEFIIKTLEEIIFIQQEKKKLP
jgi:hypothetical protein